MILPDRAALGTMHGKAAAIAPPLARLGITLVVPEELDTDRFGTFTAEITRTGTMEDAARAKAHAAIAATGLSIGIASEGAYGPHPFIPFLPIGREELLWQDVETSQEVIERFTDPAPCYDHVTVSSADEATAFLARIGFPRTAVIVAPVGEGSVPVAKGLQERDSVPVSHGCCTEEIETGVSLWNHEATCCAALQTQKAPRGALCLDLSL